MRIELIGLAIIFGLILTACTPAMRENINYAYFKEQQRWNGSDRWQDFKDLFDFERLYNSYGYQEAQANKEICRHPNQNRRVTTQGNVEDGVEYTECAVQPGPAEPMGQRLTGRPRV